MFVMKMDDEDENLIDKDQRKIRYSDCLVVETD